MAPQRLRPCKKKNEKKSSENNKVGYLGATNDKGEGLTASPNRTDHLLPNNIPDHILFDHMLSDHMFSWGPSLESLGQCVGPHQGRVQYQTVLQIGPQTEARAEAEAEAEAGVGVGTGTGAGAGTWSWQAP